MSAGRAVVWHRTALPVGQHWSARVGCFELLAFRFLPDIEWTVAVLTRGTPAALVFAVRGGSSRDARVLAGQLVPVAERAVRGHWASGARGAERVLS